MTTPDIVVIGAGAIGASAAYELTLRGATVRIVDHGTQPAAGCSRANAGLLVPSHSEPLTGAGNIRTGLRHMLHQDSAFHLRPRPTLLPWLWRYTAASSHANVEMATRLLRDLGLASLQRHADYSAMEIPTSFTRHGMIDIYAAEHKRQQAQANLQRNPIGLDYETLSPDEVNDAVPGTRAAGGGILFRNEAHCDSRVFVEATIAAAQRCGAELSLATRATAIGRKHGRVTGVHTSRGFIPAGAVVLAAGHRSAELARPLGLPLPLAPAKGYVIDLETAPGDPTIPIGLKDDMIVLTPYPDRLRLAGSLELVGPDTTINHRRTRTIRLAATRALPHLQDRPTRAVWAGLRPCSPDGLPMIGPTRVADGLILATGHGQQGLVLAPATGCAVADELYGPTPESPGLPRAAFSPDRFRRGAAMRVEAASYAPGAD